MIMCSACKQNVAVVFFTKIVQGNATREGLCLSCARQYKVPGVSEFIEQSGMTDEDIENVSRQMTVFLQGTTEDGMMGADNADPQNNIMNSFMQLLNGGLPVIENKGSTESFQNYSKNNENDSSRTKVNDKKAEKKRKYLDQYGLNLTALAKENKLDEVVGRDRELERVIQILNRRTKNNPVLIGEPGVGKTAIAEALAIRIAQKNVPPKLMDREIYLLDLASAVAGTQFRGQFEARLKGLIEEIKTLGNIILVIDEIHNIVSAGEAEGAMNAANILKPALARGEIHVIGATTLNEYRKYIEKDSALERRLQPVLVDEPTIQETVEIVKGIKKYYEQHHNVKIPDDVIRTAVVLSERYITDRFLPDKAIDVIDEAASRANLNNKCLMELEVLKQELASIQQQKEQCISADSIEDYQRAADLKVAECKLKEKIKNLENSCREVVLTCSDVAAVIEGWTKIPVGRISESESERLVNIEKRLHNRLIGQDKAVELVSKAIRRNRSGFKKRRKPASFIFAGPTGVGKTELVRALAVELFGSEEAMIRLDMSEYMEKHTVSKLIGSPPGYVGYDEAGQLTEKVRRKPYCVILFDEIEKAHHDVFNILLQIMEDGRLTDSHGRVVNFENVIIIMTSNAGTAFKSTSVGFADAVDSNYEARIKDALKEVFRPEFLNRVDELVVFNPLDKNELRQIAKLMLHEVKNEAKDNGIDIYFEDDVAEYVISKGYDPKYGARPLRRVIQRDIEDVLAEMYLKGEIKDGDAVSVALDNQQNQIVFLT